MAFKFGYWAEFPLYFSMMGLVYNLSRSLLCACKPFGYHGRLKIKSCRNSVGESRPITSQIQTKKRCLRCSTLYSDQDNSPTACSFHGHTTGMWIWNMDFLLLIAHFVELFGGLGNNFQYMEAETFKGRIFVLIKWGFFSFSFILFSFLCQNFGRREGIIFIGSTTPRDWWRVEWWVWSNRLQMEWEEQQAKHWKFQLEEKMELLCWVRWECPTLSTRMACFLWWWIHFILSSN